MQQAIKSRLSRLETQIGIGDGMSGPGLEVYVSFGHGRDAEVEALLDAAFAERGVSRDNPNNKIMRFVTCYNDRYGQPARKQPDPTIVVVGDS
jgi:hypothetical protein